MFWFCRNPGLALPLIALQYHEVKVKVNFETVARIFETAADCTTTSLSSTKLWADYIYLDTDERRRFAQVLSRSSYRTITVPVVSELKQVRI